MGRDVRRLSTGICGETGRKVAETRCRPYSLREARHVSSQPTLVNSWSSMWQRCRCRSQHRIGAYFGVLRLACFCAKRPSWGGVGPVVACVQFIYVLHFNVDGGVLRGVVPHLRPACTRPRQRLVPTRGWPERGWHDLSSNSLEPLPAQHLPHSRLAPRDASGPHAA